MLGDTSCRHSSVIACLTVLFCARFLTAANNFGMRSLIRPSYNHQYVENRVTSPFPSVHLTTHLQILMDSGETCRLNSLHGQSCSVLVSQRHRDLRAALEDASLECRGHHSICLAECHETERNNFIAPPTNIHHVTSMGNTSRREQPKLMTR